MILKNFAAFEGIDGSGTSTQLKLLAERLTPEQIFPTAEPTTGETGKFIRRILKGEFLVDARTMTYLFAADRCEHVFGKGGIAEKAASGKLVVSDRYLFSSLAYQSVFCGKELPALLNSPFPLPELLFYFKIDAQTALSRVAERGGQMEIYEKLDTQQKIIAQYERILSEYESREKGKGMRIITVDAAAAVPKIQEFIWNYVRMLPILKP